MRVADYIVDVLEKNGITQVFTVTGGGAIFLCDAVGRAKKIKYIACHHEQAASMKPPKRTHRNSADIPAS